MALHQTLAVQESQCVKGGRQQFLNFLRRKRPVAKDLTESLLGIFHHDEEKLAASELTQARVEKLNQVRMG